MKRKSGRTGLGGPGGDHGTTAMAVRVTRFGPVARWGGLRFGASAENCASPKALPETDTIRHWPWRDRLRERFPLSEVWGRLRETVHLMAWQPGRGHRSESGQ